MIANKKSIEEIRKFLGVDSLGYLSIEGLKRAIGQPICSGCLDEGYPTKGAKKAAENAARTGKISCNGCAGSKGDSCGCG